MSSTVVLLGSLDTKGPEYQFVRDRLHSQGLDTIVVDFGILGSPGFAPDISNREVAEAGGADLDALVAASDRGAAMAAMASGATVIVRRLVDEGRVQAALALGRHRRHLACRNRVPRPAARLPEADRLDGRFGQHGAVRRRDRPDPRPEHRRHRRAQPHFDRRAGQRRRSGRRHAARAAAPRDGIEAARGREHVRCDHAVRDASTGAPRGARVRSARLPHDRFGRPCDGVAHPPGLHRWRARRDDDRTRRQPGRRRVLGRTGSPHRRGIGRHPAGRLGGGARHGQLGRRGHRARGVPHAESVRAQLERHAHAHDGGRVRRTRHRARRQGRGIHRSCRRAAAARRHLGDRHPRRPVLRRRSRRGPLRSGAHGPRGLGGGAGRVPAGHQRPELAVWLADRLHTLITDQPTDRATAAA